MKKRIKKILLLLLVLTIIMPFKGVFAAVSTQIKAGGEILEFSYTTNSNSNQSGTADFMYTDEYPGGLLTLKNYNGGMIEIDHMVGSGTIEENPKTLYIKLEGTNEINSDDLAISSNINFNIIGSGTLKTTAKALNNDNITVVIENNENIELISDENVTNDDNEVVEEDETDKNIKEKDDVQDTLIIVAIISIIVLCSLGSIFFITGIRKNLK